MRLQFMCNLEMRKARLKSSEREWTLFALIETSCSFVIIYIHLLDLNKIAI